MSSRPDADKAALVGAWLRRLDACNPYSAAARAIYAEAKLAGLIDDLGAAVLAGVEDNRREIRELSRLRAERHGDPA